MIRALPIAFALSLIAASGAGAQEVIPTAVGGPAGGAPMPQTSAGPIIISHDDERDDRGPARVGPCGGVPDANGKMDKNPHGEVYGAVGNHGYRQYGGVVCVPVGDNVAVTIAVDRSQYKGRGW